MGSKLSGNSKRIVSATLAVVVLNLLARGAFLVPGDINPEIVYGLDFPEEEIGTQEPSLQSALVLAALAPLEEEIINHPVLQGDSLISNSLPGALARKDVVVYEVELDDTPSSIAARFGISTDSVLWSNNLENDDNIFPGQELVIPPISGIVHKVVKDETVSSIASKYRAFTSEIIAFNNLSTSEINIGQTLVIPNGKVEVRKNVAVSVARNLPTLDGYFINPTIGTISQGLHPYNAVDIANECAVTPIYAAASGLVTISKTSGWNGGAGKYVKINHPNGTQTIYAHLNDLSVGEGERVQRGQAIGKMGNTGRVRGPTGCHLHFGVYGARNPLAR